MRETYEKYKMWMPWRWLPLVVFLAIMYTAGGVFYLRDKTAAGIKAWQKGQVAGKREAPMAEEAGIDSSVGEAMTEVEKVTPVKVKVFSKRITAAAELEEVEETEEAKVREKGL